MILNTWKYSVVLMSCSVTISPVVFYCRYMHTLPSAWQTIPMVFAIKWRQRENTATRMNYFPAILPQSRTLISITRTFSLALPHLPPAPGDAQQHRASGRAGPALCRRSRRCCDHQELPSTALGGSAVTTHLSPNPRTSSFSFPPGKSCPPRWKAENTAPLKRFSTRLVLLIHFHVQWSRWPSRRATAPSTFHLTPGIAFILCICLNEILKIELMFIHMDIIDS